MTSTDPGGQPAGWPLLALTASHVKIDRTPILPTAISLLLVAQSEPVAYAAASALNTEPRVPLALKCVETRADALVVLGNEVVDIMLTEMNLPGGKALDLISNVSKMYPTTKIMVVTRDPAENAVLCAIKAGAAGFYHDTECLFRMTEILQTLLAGHSPISASAARSLVEHVRQQQASARLASGRCGKLTPREIDVLWGIAKGLSYAEIANHLDISKHTVPGHIKSIYRKLGVNTRGEAVFEALQLRLLATDNAYKAEARNTECQPAS